MIVAHLRNLARLTSLLFAAALVAGCTDETGGEPTGVPSAPSSAVSPSSSAVVGAAPKVATALDPGPFLRRPCDLISKSALKEYGFTKPGEADVDSRAAKELHGPTCHWLGDDMSLGVAIHTPNQRNGNGGLGPIYSGKENGLYSYLEPMEIPGHSDYPAVSAESRDERPEGHCPLFVGIQDDLVFVIQSNYDAKPEESCPAALKAAAAVLDTLKGAS